MIALCGMRSNKDWKTEDLNTYLVEGLWKRETDDIYNIIINNIKGTTVGRQCCSIIRLLNHDGIKMFNIFINNVMDTARDGEGRTDQAINIGDDHPYWTIQRNQLGETSRIFINNVVSNAPTVIRIRGTLKDAILTNIVGYGENTGLRKYSSNGLIQYGEAAQIENVKIEAHQF